MLSHKIKKSVPILHRRYATYRFAIVNNTFERMFEHFASTIPRKCVDYPNEVDVFAIR